MLSVIIPTWNQSAFTIRCLDALAKHTVHGYEVLWIDNGSTDAEHNAVLRHVRRVRHKLERHPKPLGFPKAINRGLQLVSGDYVVMLNNDVEVMDGWDTELVGALARGKGAAGPVAIQPGGWQAIKFHPWLGVMPSWSHETIHGLLRQRWRGVFKDVHGHRLMRGWRPMLAFFCTVFNREVIQRVGQLDERFGVGFGEDDDYAKRMKAAGYTLWLCPGAVVKHALSATMRHLPGGVNKQLQNSARLLRDKYAGR